MKELLENLKFVQGAVHENRLDTTLSHFLMRDGFVTGFNGHMQITAPMPENITMAPKAKELVNALEQCSNDVAVSVTPTGNLRIVSGDFSAVVPTIPHEDIHLDTDSKKGVTVMLPKGILHTLTGIKPFISDDASREWSMGVLFNRGFVYATNNILVAKLNAYIRDDWCFNLPLYIVNEILRIKEEPNCLVFHDNNARVTVHYPGGRRLTASLGSMQWPNLNNILDNLTFGEGMPADTLIDAVSKVARFSGVDNDVYIAVNCVSTSLDADENGAIVSIGTSAITTSRFNIEMINKLAGEGNMVDLSTYPSPASFWNSGTGLVGAIVGMAI